MFAGVAVRAIGILATAGAVFGAILRHPGHSTQIHPGAGSSFGLSHDRPKDREHPAARGFLI